MNTISVKLPPSEDPEAKVENPQAAEISAELKQIETDRERNPADIIQEAAQSALEFGQPLYKEIAGDATPEEAENTRQSLRVVDEEIQSRAEVALEGH